MLEVSPLLIISAIYCRISEISRYFWRADISPRKYRDILGSRKYRAISDISAIFSKISRDDLKYLGRVFLRLQKTKIVFFFFISVSECWRRKGKSFVVLVKEGLKIKRRLSPPIKIFLWIKD